MCGIAGVISLNPQEVSLSRLKAMTDAIIHRGPDGDGHWISPSGTVGLGHRRLSIIDLSHEADQPMHFLNRYTLVFNGEIYNYVELRETLQQQGYLFQTQSDTEVLMALYDRDQEQCLKLLDGMFAFVLYDQKEHKVFMARDRFGEKPFFYHYEKGKSFVFGSEMKALWAGGLPREVNHHMLFNYLSFGYIENPEDLSETFYTGCVRFPHSHYATMDLRTMELKIQKYYDIDWRHQNLDISAKEAQEKFHDLFFTSIARRLRSDVTVGSSLSGGLDSSLVVCTINELKKGTHQKQNTFSAVFPGFEKDERKYMDYVIAETKVEPYFVTPDEDDLIKNLQTLCWHQEEPFRSSSIYVQYCVNELAKKHKTTVLLDGQGADELLSGYHHYFLPFFEEMKGLDQSLFQKQMSGYTQLHQGNSINGLLKKPLGYYVRHYAPFLEKGLKGLRLDVQQLRNPLYSNDFYGEQKKQTIKPERKEFKSLNEALYYSYYQFGLQQLLRYADRNSMAHGVEVRLPFLSHELAEFIFSLPTTFKMDQGWTKKIMRDTFSILPEKIRWRVDKIGYEPPQKKWMENERFRDYIREGRKKMAALGIMHTKHIDSNILTPDAMDMNQQTWRELMVFTLFDQNQ